MGESSRPNPEPPSFRLPAILSSLTRAYSSQFAKPENALQRANELVAVGQSQTALQTLHDTITSKRFRTWQQTMESIMLRYVELCVELQKGKLAKDGLIQYRMSCQHVNIASLEVVISHLLSKAEEALATAKANAGIELLPDDDVTPESLVAALTAGESSSADKAQVEQVLPWMKFLWEVYRTVLEILRNNAKLESVYQGTAQRALMYCLKYSRNSEFKRLCDILRSHLANLNKYGQNANISLTNPETVQFMIETRFVQLDVACQLELWQEAFRSIEDIHSLMQVTRKPLKGGMVRQYFDRLATIFWASENHLLHAHALYKLYDKAVSLKATEEETAELSSKLLVAALCVPLHENKKASAQYYDFDIDRDRGLRLSSLLGLTTSLDCKVLLQELVTRGVPTIVSSEVSDLYQLLQTGLDPLELCEKARPVLAKLEGTYDQYLPALKKTICVRLLGQLGEVYHAMQMSSLETLAAGIVTMQEMEKVIVEAVRNNHIQVRLDFQTRTLRFGDEGIEYDDIRWQLDTLHQNLNKAIYLVQPELREKEEASKKRTLQMLANELPQEHERVLSRKEEIESRKEQDEKDFIIKAKQEKERQAEKERQVQLAEKKRQADAAIERQKQQEILQIRREQEEDRIAAAKRIQATGMTDISMDKLKQMTSEQIEMEQRKIATKQREDREQKLATAAKRLDYMERARRILEQPRLEKDIEQRKEQDMIFFNQHVQSKLDAHKAQYDEDFATKQTMMRMDAAKSKYEADLLEIRKAAYAQLQESRKAEWEADMDRERESRKAQYISQRRRKKEQEAREEQQRTEAEERAAEEADRRQQHEGEREDRMRQQNDQSEQLNAQAQRQREREDEIMSKQGSRFGGGGGDQEGGRWGARQGSNDGGGGDGPAASGGGWRSRAAGGGDREEPRGGGGGWGADRGGDRDGGSRFGGGFGGGRDREEPRGGGGGWGGDRGGDRDGGSRFGGGFGGGRDREEPRGGGSAWGGDRGGDRDGGSRFGGGFGGGRDREEPRGGGGGWGGDRGGDRGGGGDRDGGSRFGGGFGGGRDREEPRAGGGGWGGDRGGDRDGGRGGGREERAPREDRGDEGRSQGGWRGGGSGGGGGDREDRAPPREGGWQSGRAGAGGTQDNSSSGGGDSGGGWRTAK